MPSYHRFPKKKWLRLMDQLIQDCYWQDPGDPYVDDRWLKQTTAQNRRQEARAADFEAIADRATWLRDAISTLRK